MRTIYRALCNANGQSYIGQTKNLEQRKKAHLSDLRRGHHTSKKFQRAYNKYGEASFTFEVLQDEIPDDQGKERETYWITFHDSVDNGFNFCFGGSERYGKTCVWDGVTYRSVKLAAKATGINYGTLVERMYRGYTCYEDIPEGWRKPTRTSR